MNILVIASHKGGIHYHRQMAPAKNLKEQYGHTIGVCEVESILKFYSKKIKWDIIWWSVVVPMEETDIMKWFEIFRAKGSKVVVDIDDYWIRDDDIKYNSTKLGEDRYVWSTEASITYADLVTTTTERLSTEIKKLNPSTVVLPNAIDVSEPQWKMNDKPIGDEIIFGYLGSTKHERDVRIMNYNFKQNKKQCLALEQYTPLLGATEKMELQTIDTYGEMYDRIDVSVVPLVNTKFSHLKSPLKMVEAGAKGRAVMAQNIPPYSDHQDLAENCVMVDDGNWEHEINSLSRKRVVEMQKGLHKVVMERYTIPVVNKKREECFYLLSKNNIQTFVICMFVLLWQ